MSDHWDFYACNVNGRPASIFVDLGICRSAPNEKLPWLAFVWLYMQAPRPDGLSSSEEFDFLVALEDGLVSALKEDASAQFVGRITTEARREFYFYMPENLELEDIVKTSVSKFPEYQFDVGTQKDDEWNQYLSLLYPSDEQLEGMKNRKVLEKLEENGDLLEEPRDVRHWIYFESEDQRHLFNEAAQKLQFKIDYLSEDLKSLQPYCTCVVRKDLIDSNSINDVVLELVRLSKVYGAEYDGWETQVITPPEE